MTHIELNAILYYADFLSLKQKGVPVTDNCKYFFIHGCPINSAFIVNLEPEYDKDNEFLTQASQEFQTIQDKYDEEAALSFIDDICSIKACGCVDAISMIKCIHQYDTKQEKKAAIKQYNEWKKEQFYSHLTINENGDPQEVACTKYFKHAETGLARRGISKSLIPA